MDRTPGNHLGDGYDYQIVVGAAVKKLRVRPVLTDSFASFAVLTACNCEQCNCAPQKNMYGGSVLDVDVDIPYGETTITVQVTAEDVSLKTNYTVRVLRKLLLSCTAAYMKGQGLPCSAPGSGDRATGQSGAQAAPQTSSRKRSLLKQEGGVGGSMD